MSQQQPIGQRNTVPSDGFDQGEHGAGIGVSGGLEGDRSNTLNQHPIADKYMGSSGNTTSQYQSSGQYSQGRTADTARDNYTAPLGHGHGHGQGHEHNVSAELGLGAPIGGGGHTSVSSGRGVTTEHTVGSGYSSTSGGYSSSTGGQYQQSGTTQSHHHHHSGSSTTGDAVSGAYSGGGVRDALTGESHAHTTGAGVGSLGENLHQSSHSSHAGNAALAGTAAGATAAAGTGLGQDSYGSRSAQRDTGTGVGAAGGAGGHYTVPEGESTSRRTQANGGQTGQTGYGGLATGAGAGAAVGAGAVGASHHGQTGVAGNETGRTSGSYGRSSHDNDSAKDLDTGGPHSLVFQESTGKYVHRRDL